MPEPGLEQLANRLANVHRHLRKRLGRQGQSCWRLYEKDISDQPLIVDWYDGDAVCWVMPRTRDETPEQAEVWVAGVRAAIARGLALDDARIWLKRRQRQEDRQHGGQYQPLADARAVKVVGEGALRFEVNLSDYLDTGLFLDHRPLRARVGAEAAGRDVLNLFCYTGAFSCHAAVGGARSTTSVDLSNTYLAWAQRNLALNGVAGAAHRTVRADVLEWLKTQPAGGYDLVVCDPPTFSNSAAMRGSFSVDRDHAWVVRACLRLLRPGGTLWFSTNSRSFRLDDTLVPLAPEDATEATIPEDFRNRRIHRCWRFSPPRI